jgi:hypothetical protein
MPEIGESIGEIGGVIRTMLGLTPNNRVRDQIRETAELYSLTIQYEGLASSSDDLAQVVDLHTKRLVEMASGSGRSWNWAALIVCWMVAGALGVAAYFLKPHWGTWWGTLLMIVVGFIGFLFVIAGVGTLLQQTADEA